MTWHFPHMVRAVTGDTEIDYDAIADREIADAIWPTAGVANTGDLKVTQHAAGANLTVDVAAGKVAIPCTGIANGGKYLSFNDATINVDMGSPPSAGQYRTDSVIVHQYDRLVDSNSNVDTAGYMPVLEVVNGPASGTQAGATPPSLPPAGVTWAGYYELARVLRHGGESSVVTANITDMRTIALPGAVGARRVTNVPTGLGTYDPAKPVLVASAWVEQATDSSGYLNIGTPGGTTCVVFATGTYVYRTAPTPASGQVLLRLDGSTVSSLRWQFRDGSGTAITSQFVGFWYRLEYQV